jgi:hypothetical protein
MSVSRDAVAARTGMDSLMADPSLWGSVRESFQQLRRDYASAYLAHHARYHEEAAATLAELEALRPQVDALARFNEVPEFGGPLGAGIPDRFAEVVGSVRSCRTVEDDITLEDAPECSSCRLSLSESVPRRQATLLMSETAGAMGEYGRRISSEGVRRILSDPNREQLEKLINMVQVSDLSALANVLDDEVVEFLRRFVRVG